MELKKAIERVAKVCPRAKEQAKQYGFIRFYPAWGEFPAYVFATDGVCSAMVSLDKGVDVPNVLLEVDLLLKAAKAQGQLSVQEVGYGHVEIRAIDDAAPGTLLYKVQAKNFDNFPGPPIFPEKGNFKLIANWSMVSKVFHAAGKEGAGGELSVVHFDPAFVEATDKNRLARVEVEGPWDGLVPTRLFKSWPKGLVKAAFHGGHAFFMVGSEVRISGIVKFNYPDTKTVVPKAHPGPTVLVQTASFQEAVERGTKVSDIGLVNIAFEGQQMTLRAWAKEAGGVGDSFEAMVPVLHGNAEPGSVLVKGKYLEEALKAVTTPNVKVGYGGMADPLRIESGLYIACLWQMAY